MKLQLIVFGFLMYATLAAQPVTIRSVTEKDVNAIDYPNMAGNTRSTQAHKGTVTLKDGTTVQGKVTLFKKKEVFDRVKVNTGEEKKEIPAGDIASIKLDPIVYERSYPNDFKNPEKNFQPGYIVLASGEKLNGKVAQLRDFSDYDFFVYSIAFLPEGSNVASTIKGGALSEFAQEIAGKWNVWDGYADGYLLRLTEGRYRLSRNPYSKTKNEFFTGLKNEAAGELSKEATEAAFERSVKSGSNLNESIENATSAGSAVGEVLGSIEVNRKEFLILDTKTRILTTVNKDNYKENLYRLAAGCPAFASATVAWDKIQEAIEIINNGCQ